MSTREGRFQALIGTVETACPLTPIAEVETFQALIGTVETEPATSSRVSVLLGFKPS